VFLLLLFSFLLSLVYAPFRFGKGEGETGHIAANRKRIC
jgi:hypothetical protein